MAVFMTDFFFFFFFFWETNTDTNTILCSLVIVPSSLILLSSNSAKLLSSRMVICTIFLVFILPALPRDYVPTNLNMLMIYLPNTICLPPRLQPSKSATKSANLCPPPLMYIWLLLRGFLDTLMARLILGFFFNLVHLLS